MPCCSRPAGTRAAGVCGGEKSGVWSFPIVNIQGKRLVCCVWTSPPVELR